MQKTILTVFQLIALMLPFAALAQGTLEVSNLEQTPTGSAAISSDSWIAQSIYTGNNTGGYILNSVELLMNAATGTPTGFDVSLYSSMSSGPGLNLGDLIGSSPLTSGDINYSTSGITLSADTFYYVVLTAATPEAEGAFVWSKGQQYAFGSDGWEIYPGFYTSTSGRSWVGYGRAGAFQMALFASPVPEPSSMAIGAIGAWVFGWQRWRKTER